MAWREKVGLLQMKRGKNTNKKGLGRFYKCGTGLEMWLKVSQAIQISPRNISVMMIK
jgi:hypothetical protein